MKNQTVVKIRELLVLIILLVVPVVFYRGVIEAFDLVKATMLWLGALVIGATFLFGTRQDVAILRQRNLWPIYLFAVAATFTTIFSSYPVISLFGQSQRYTGLLTIFACCLVAVSIVLFSRRALHRAEWSIVVSAAFVIGYGVLQQFEIDPFEWSTTFSAAFASIGNPNTASAWVAVVVVFLFGMFLGTSAEKIAQRWSLLALLSLSGPVIAGFEAAQGSFVLAVIFVVLFLWLKQQIVTRKEGLVGLALSLVVVITAQLNQTRALYLISLLGVAIIGALSQLQIKSLSAPLNIFGGQSLRRKALIVGAGLLIATGSVFVFQAKIADGFKSGFLERGDFFRTARDIFLKNPIFGSGLETYGLFFGSFRPEGHATRFEPMRSSSAHNVYFGMFSNGGVVLGLSYLFLVSFTLIAGYRYAKKFPRQDPLFLGAMGSLLAYQIIGIVSVEHVALHLLNFTLIGLVLNRIRVTSDSNSGGSTRFGTRSRNRRRQQIGASVFLAIVGTAVLVPVGVWQVTRPFRAATHAFDGEVYARVGRLEDAEDSFSRSVGIYPWALQGWLGLSQLQINRNDFTNASDSAMEALRRTRYSGAVSGLMVSIVFRSGNIELAVQSSREAADLEPFAASVQRQFAEVLFLASGVTYDSDPEAASKYLDELFGRFPDFQREGLDEILQALSYPR